MNERLGERKQMNCGLCATIIAYRNSMDVDLKFDDGSIREHVQYNHFKNGLVRNKKTYSKTKKHIGEIQIIDGEEVEIIDYSTVKDIKVLFKDGTILDHVKYSDFKNKTLSKKDSNKTQKNLKKNRIGEERVMNNGVKATIIAYSSCNDLTVQLEDGVIKKNVSYKAFKEGSINCTSKKKSSKRIQNLRDLRIGEAKIMNNGLKATIIDYENAANMVIQFENGAIKEHVHYSNFKRGLVSVPKSFKLFREQEILKDKNIVKAEEISQEVKVEEKEEKKKKNPFFFLKKLLKI